MPQPPARLLLDGGLATELEHRGYDVSGPLWSASILRSAPHAIEQIHYDYFAAGATCAISASYQASYEGFATLGLSAEDTTRLLQLSVSLAQSARDRYRAATDLSGADQGRLPQLCVAASVGPYGATRHDGSEYHGNYGLSVAELTVFHDARFNVLAESTAEALACETIPSLDEARALATLLRNHPDRMAWVSFTSPDGMHTSHGETLDECARFLDAIANVVAIGVNCVDPTLVTRAIQQLRRATGKLIVVYPNSGERWDARARRWSGHPHREHLADHVVEWADAGAQWIGGCCRTRPADIAEISSRLARHYRVA